MNINGKKTTFVTDGKLFLMFDPDTGIQYKYSLTTGILSINSIHTITNIPLQYIDETGLEMVDQLIYGLNISIPRVVSSLKKLAKDNELDEVEDTRLRYLIDK